jgi:heme-degrading monooxygenase HmoA
VPFVVIVRVLRARIKATKIAAFDAVFRSQVALIREQPGIMYVKFARRIQPDGTEDAVLFEEWEDSSSMYAWVGPDLAEPRLVPGVRALIDDVEVAHFESLDDDDDVAQTG